MSGDRVSPQYLGLEEALNLARVNRAQRISENAVAEYRVRQCLRQLEIFRQEWSKAAKDLREIDTGIASLVAMAQQDNVNMEGFTSSLRFVSQHADSLSSSFRVKPLLGRPHSAGAKRCRPAVNSSSEADSNHDSISGVRKCVISFLASTYPMIIKILAVDQVLQNIPHYLKTDNGFEYAMSLARDSRVEQSAHVKAAEYRIRRCVRLLEIFRQELEKTERGLREVDRGILTLVTLTQQDNGSIEGHTNSANLHQYDSD